VRNRMFCGSLQYHVVGGTLVKVGPPRGSVEYFRRVRRHRQYRSDTSEGMCVYSDAQASRCCQMPYQIEESHAPRKGHNGKLFRYFSSSVDVCFEKSGEVQIDDEQSVQCIYCSHVFVRLLVKYNNCGHYRNRSECFFFICKKWPYLPKPEVSTSKETILEESAVIEIVSVFIIFEIFLVYLDVTVVH
jgi:hypothetical protein